MLRAFLQNNVVLFVGEDKPVKDVDPAIALAMAMKTDADSRSRSQNKATDFLKKAIVLCNTEFAGLCAVSVGQMQGRKTRHITEYSAVFLTQQMIGRHKQNPVKYGLQSTGFERGSEAS